MGVTADGEMERPKGNKPKRPCAEQEKRPTLKQRIGVELLGIAEDRTLAAGTRLEAIKILRGMFPSDF